MNWGQISKHKSIKIGLLYLPKHTCTKRQPINNNRMQKFYCEVMKNSQWEIARQR